MKRQVNLGILFKLLTRKGSLPVMGIIFITITLFVFIPCLIILPGKLLQPYEKYDFAGIEKNGIEKTAKVAGLQSLGNITINDKHPEIVSYQYGNNGQIVSDKFETLDLDKITNLSAGSEVSIVVYQNQSMIKGLSPFVFPVWLFYILPIAFLTLGIPSFLTGLIPALKTFKLYKNGIIKEAHLVSINISTPAAPNRGIQQEITVNYYFEGEQGAKVFGESKTNDLLILNTNKAGDVIKIFVSESDETKSCLVPNLEAMKYNWDLNTLQAV